jgi:hypothetical protein
MGTMAIVAQEWFRQNANLDLATTASTLVFHAEARQDRRLMRSFTDTDPGKCRQLPLLHGDGSREFRINKRDLQWSWSDPRDTATWKSRI